MENKFLHKSVFIKIYWILIPNNSAYKIVITLISLSCLQGISDYYYNFILIMSCTHTIITLALHSNFILLIDVVGVNKGNFQNIMLLYAIPFNN